MFEMSKTLRRMLIYLKKQNYRSTHGRKNERNNIQAGATRDNGNRTDQNGGGSVEKRRLQKVWRAHERQPQLPKVIRDKL